MAYKDVAGVTVTGFKLKGNSFILPDDGVMLIEDIVKKFNLQDKSVTWILNGEPIPASLAAKTEVKNGDNLRAARSNVGG